MPRLRRLRHDLAAVADSRISPRESRANHMPIKPDTTHATMTPREIVQELDRHIVGQHAAKRAVAIALRNRWRRMQLDAGAAQRGDAEEHPDDRPDRRRQDRDRAPPGDARQRAVREGRGHALHRGRLRRQGRRADRARPRRHRGQDVPRAGQAARAHAGRGTRRGTHPRCAAAAPRGADACSASTRPRPRSDEPSSQRQRDPRQAAQAAAQRRARRARDRDSKPRSTSASTSWRRRAWRRWASSCGRCSRRSPARKTHKRTLTINAARPQLIEEEAGKLVNEDDVREAAIEACEQHGIVFIDEIDKVAKRGENVGGGDVSREGVQRDLLPLVEGSTVSTKYGPVQDRPHPVHRLGRVPPGQAQRPDPGTAGPLPDPRRTDGAEQGRLRPHPHRAQGRADHAVHRAAARPKA